MANANKWLLLGFGAIWTLLVFVSYMGLHPYYGLFLQDLPNIDILLALAVSGAGAWWWQRSRKKPVRGWMIYAFVMIMEVLIFLIYANREDIFTNSPAAHLPYFLGYNLLIQAAVLYLFLVQLALGDLLLSRLPLSIGKASQPVVKLAFGLSVTGFVLVILGLTGLLNKWVLWGLTVLPVVLRYKFLMHFLQQLFWAPIKSGVKTGWGIVPVLLLLAGVAINLLTSIKAFPIGFDAVALYMNRSHLIAEYGALIAGGQADAWPLWTSLGELMFGSVTISIFLSHAAMLLCIWAVFRLARLMFSREASWLVVTLVYLNPAFSFHAAHDAKVDLGFLFIVLATLLALFDSRQHQDEVKPSVGMPSSNRQTELATWVLAGWLSGYAFGIKYTAIMFIIGIMAVLFRWNWGWRGAAGLFLTALGGLFLAGIDQFGYMELGDTPTFTFSLISIGLGLPLLVWGMIRNRAAITGTASVMAGFGLAALLSFSPWMVKNGLEHDQISLNNLLVGQASTVMLDPTLSANGQESQIEFQKRVFNNSLSNLGLSLDPTQRQRADSILAETIAGGDSTQVNNQYLAARNRIIQEVLLPEQRQIAEASITEFGLAYSEMSEKITLSCELILESLKRRDIVLDETQKAAVIALLRSRDVMVEDAAERRKILAALRQEIFNTVLTPEQYETATGKKQGALAEAFGKHPAKASLFGGTKREEIRRYLGFEKGAPLYLSMPYDLTMNTNIPFSRYLDISFLFLLLLPFLFFSRSLIQNSVVAGGFILFWLIAVLSLYPSETRIDPTLLNSAILAQMGEPLTGLGALTSFLFPPLQTGLVQLALLIQPIYTLLEQLAFLPTFCLIILLFGGAIWLLRDKLQTMPSTLANFIVFALAFGGLWFFFSNAIIWYGFALFICGFFLVVWMTDHLPVWYPDLPSGAVLKCWRVAVGTSMALCLSLFLVSATQDRGGARLIFQSPFLQYAASDMTAEESLAQFRPYMLEAIQKMNEDPKTKIYRIGTHLNYHILQNDKRVLEDNQLGIYSDLTRKTDDKEVFLRTLIENGFRYVLYNVNLAGTDLTPEKTLAKKADEVLNLLFDSSLAVPIYTDNFIEDPAVPTTKVGDKTWPGKPGLGGKTTVPGTFILFELAKLAPQ